VAGRSCSGGGDTAAAVRLIRVAVRIVTWNINSIRSRLERALDWIEANEPDVVCFQETKCETAAFPRQQFEALGYSCAHHGAPGGYNGVAIVSRAGLDDVAAGFPGDQPPPFDEPRLIAATCNGVRVLNIYGPHGRDLGDPHYQFKLLWFKRLELHLLEEAVMDVPSVIVGDYNIAPTAIDVYSKRNDPKRTHTSDRERGAFAELVDLGFTDMLRREHPEATDLFTYWSYKSKLGNNHGMRIDHILASAPVDDRFERCWAAAAERHREHASDHVPVVLDIR